MMTDTPAMIDQKTEQIFLEALDIADPKERERFVASACKGDQDKKSSVEALLRANGRAENVFPTEPGNRTGAEWMGELSERPGRTIGRYKLLEKIGEGGMGVVYMAEQEEPVRRRVALKIIKLGMDTKQVVARFEAERQALALMDHPHIAKVFDGGIVDRPLTGPADTLSPTGREGRGEGDGRGIKGEGHSSQPSTLHSQLLSAGRPYFVMELVRGIPITRFCEENQLSIHERLKLFIPVCHAIQHAHQKGIIHRDIKPSNVLVTLNEGVPHPMVIDFGVAKAMDQRLTEKTYFTRFTQMIGTPAYMSPEQAEMSKADVDTRSDVYSLGILLYELLTGTTPFPEERLRNASYAEMQRILSEEEPLRPSTVLSRLNGHSRAIAANRRSEPATLIKHIKGDLDWIVLKAIEKDRNRRYATPNELAADIERFLNDEPIHAHAVTRIERAVRWCRRKPALATSLFLISILLLIVIIGSPIAAYRINKARQEAVHQARQARLNQYVADINLAHRAIETRDLGRARQLLESHAESGEQEDFRGWEWDYLWERTRSEAEFKLGEHPDAIRCVAYSPSGRIVASGDLAGNVKLWDFDTRSLIRAHRETRSVHQIVFLSEHILITANQSGIVSFYDVPPGQILQTVSVGASVRAIALSPDRRKLACLTGSDGSEHLKMWDVAPQAQGGDLPSLALAFDLPGPDRHVVLLHQGALSFSPDGSELAIGYSDGAIKIIAAQNGEIKRTLEGSRGAIATLAHSADGRWLASGAIAPDKVARIWDTQSGRMLVELSGHTRWVSRVAFAAADTMLLTSSTDQTVQVWETATWQVTRSFQGHAAPIWAMAVSPSDDGFITGGRDQSLLNWTLTGANRERDSIQLPGLRNFAFVPSDGSLVTVEEQQGDAPMSVAKIRRPPDYEAGQVLADLGNDVIDVRVDSRGTQMVVLGRASLRLWDWQNHRLAKSLKLVGADSWNVLGFTENNAEVLLVDRQFRIRSWKPGTSELGEPWSALGSHTPPTYFDSRHTAFHPATGTLVLGSDGFALVWDVQTKALRGRLGGHQFAPVFAAISPDGERIVTTGDDGKAFLWDARTLALLSTFQTPRGSLQSVTFSPDGRRIAMGLAPESAVGIYDVETGRELVIIPDAVRMATRIQWSPDGRTLVARGAQGAVWRPDAQIIGAGR